MRLAPVRWREAGFTPASAIARGATFNAMDFPATLGFDGLSVAVRDAVFGPLDDVLACLRTFGTAGGADMQWSFPPARIDASAVEALADSYERMLDAALADPSQPLRQVQALAAGPAAIATAPVIDDATVWRLEDDITRIFAGLLHSPALTPASDLTDHGLHSLLAIRALGPVTRALRNIVAAGRDVTVADVLGHPSPAALAARLLDRPVVARPQASTPALSPVPGPAAVPTSPAATTPPSPVAAIAPPSAGATQAAFPCRRCWKASGWPGATRGPAPPMPSA
ncbi:phosphopantetheine-binding protein [Tistrella bauzanensis]